MKPKKDVFANSEDKWDFIIALIVIVIFTVFIYLFMFKTKDKVIIDTTTKLDKPQIESIAIVNKKDQFLYTNSSKYQVKTIKAENAYQSEIDSAVVISDIIKNKPVVMDTISKPIVIDSILKPINTQIEVSDSKATTSSKNRTEVKDTIITTQEPAIQLEQKELPKTTSVQLEQQETKQKTINATLNCVIIVGVFKEASNKTAVINKLISLGYTHSEGVLREGLNYVGVPVACDDKQEKQKLLSALNQAFGIQSWVKKI